MDRSYQGDYSVLQDKISKNSLHKSNNELDISSIGNISNSSNSSVKKRKFSSMMDIQKDEKGDGYSKLHKRG